MIEIKVPLFPQCEEPCGSCYNEDESLNVFVAAVLVRVGDNVEEGDVLAEVETNKTTIEVTAPCDGVVRELKVRNADSVTENSVLMTLDD